MLLAGLPDRIGAVTVNKVCASGMKAVAIARDAILAGSGETIVAGGMGSMRRAPYLVKEARWGIGYNHLQFPDAMIHHGLWDVDNPIHKGGNGESLGERVKATRRVADPGPLQSR